MNTSQQKVSYGLSDLFFNHRLDHYDALHNGDEQPSMEETRAAVLKDATDFCALLHAAYGVNEEPAALVDDFMDRV